MVVRPGPVCRLQVSVRGPAGGQRRLEAPVQSGPSFAGPRNVTV